MPTVSESRRRSPACTSSSRRSTATSGACSSRPTGASGSRTAARWSRATGPTASRARSSGCTTTCTRPTTGTCPFGTARVVLHDLREGGPTDGATLEPRPVGREPPRRVHPAGRGPRLRRAHRHGHHLPGRRLLQPGRRARRGVGRSGRRRRLGCRRPDPVGARPGQPAACRPARPVAAPTGR